MTKELKPKEETQLATVKPVRQGFEVPCQADDLIIPRAKLFNGLPKEYEQYPDAKPGQILNNITKEVLPPLFIPVMRHIEWIRFNPTSPKLADGKTDNPAFDKAFNPNEIIWRSTDPNDPRVIAESAWGANGEKPLALKFLNFLSYFPGASMPVLVSFYKTSYNTGKAINSVLEYDANHPMFYHSFKLTTKIIKTGEHSHYAFQSNYAGKASDEDFKAAQALYNTFIGRKVDAKAEYVD